MSPSPRTLPLKRFPNPVATFNDLLCFTTLTSRDTAKGPFYHPLTKKPCSLFTLDNEMHYTSFFHDHGPFNLAYVYRACIKINDKLEKVSPESPLCIYTAPEAAKKSNMALITCLYYVLVENEKPWDAFRAVAHLEMMPFRDAGNGPRDFALSVQDCLWGVWKARKEKLIDMREFDPQEYEYLELPVNGDLNIMGPFIPFASPVDRTWIAGRRPSTPSRLTNHGFKTILKVFDRESVGVVVRLNDELYDSRHFTEKGINHVEMYFDDGTNPSDDIVHDFIDLAEKYIEKGMKVAVHCKAGLGRTGVLIGAYLIYKYSFTAPEVIGFMRVIRPGMVVGAQQHYMVLNQQKWIGWAARDTYIREAQPMNPLATPPIEDDFQSPTSPGAAPWPGLSLVSKAGDALGQPRKIKLEPIDTPLLPIQSQHTPGEYIHSIGSRGTKRGATRASLPRFDSDSAIVPPSSPRGAVVRDPVSDSSNITIRAIQSRLERSTSTSSTVSLISDIDSRASKRRPAPPLSPSTLTLGLSSPPPSREVTPEENTVVDHSSVSTTSIGSVGNTSYSIATGELSLGARVVSEPLQQSNTLSRSGRSLIPTRKSLLVSPPSPAHPVLSPISERNPTVGYMGLSFSPRVSNYVKSNVERKSRSQPSSVSAHSRIPTPLNNKEMFSQAQPEAQAQSLPQSPRRGMTLTPSRMWNHISRMTSCELKIKGSTKTDAKMET